MATKSNRARQQARERRAIATGLTSKHLDKERKTQAGREVLLDSESKALLIEMREYGFAPPRGLPTQKQFTRYAAYRKARAASRASSIAEDELAIIQAEGGFMSRIYERLNKPDLKDTAFANLMTLGIRAAALAPSISGMTAEPDDSAASLPEEDRVDALFARFGGEL